MDSYCISLVKERNRNKNKIVVFLTLFPLCPVNCDYHIFKPLLFTNLLFFSPILTKRSQRTHLFQCLRSVMLAHSLPLISFFFPLSQSPPWENNWRRRWKTPIGKTAKTDRQHQHRIKDISFPVSRIKTSAENHPLLRGTRRNLFLKSNNTIIL